MQTPITRWKRMAAGIRLRVRRALAIAGKLSLALVALAAVALAVGVAIPLENYPLTPASHTGLTVIEDVSVVDTRIGRIVDHQTVIVAGRRIVYAGSIDGAK